MGFCLISFPLDMNHGVRLLDHIAALFLDLEGTSILFSTDESICEFIAGKVVRRLSLVGRSGVLGVCLGRTLPSSLCPGQNGVSFIALCLS